LAFDAEKGEIAAVAFVDARTIVRRAVNVIVIRLVQDQVSP
jgi:hypothetical protein